MSREFLDASIPELVSKLSTEEKVLLLSAPNWWNTHAIPRLNIPGIRMSDGPNGVRGSSHFVSTPAQCIPCATSMASTFDIDLLHDVGVFLADEAKVKSSVILLAPTCNIQRNPLGGRAFESFSEDPHLSGTMAAAYVNGLQSRGVAATIKHFTGNDQEHERTAADSVMSDRALREIYLYPISYQPCSSRIYHSSFMLAQKLAKPWAFMTSYGRVKGVHCSESPYLLQEILRKDWGFDGIVMSDWFGTYSVDLAINAGLDLEMPGPPRWRTPLLVNHTLSCQKLTTSTLDARASAMLAFVQRQAARNPDVVFGDGAERTRDTPEGRAFCRRLAASGLVLLRNERAVLPLAPATAPKVALIGPNVKDRVISGGGSAALKASYVVTPFAGITENAPEGIDFAYEVGCYSFKYTPTLEACLTTPSGETGWICTFYNADGSGAPIGGPVKEYVIRDTKIRLNDFLPEGLGETWMIKLVGKLTMDKTAEYDLGLTVAGRAKLYIDGKMLVDNWTKQRPGEFYYGQGTMEELGAVSLEAGKPVDIMVEYTNTNPPDGEESDRSQPALMRGVRIGGCEKIEREAAMVAAEKAAAAADVAVVVVGLSPDWESEGSDRPTLDMPGPQNELIARVAKANPNTVVVVQAGSAVAMPWVGSVAGIVQAWYSGNEVGNALADVLFGTVNPSGRLPLTFPARIQDIPSYPNFRSENGEIHYREDLFVGYKGYQSKGVAPLFPFGHGLSYTTFAFADLALSAATLPGGAADAFVLDVSVSVTNTGAVPGDEVVQVYVAMPDFGLTTPRLQLRGFAKARDVAPGQSRTVSVKLDKYAVSWWDVKGDHWKAVPGTYQMHVGKSSADLVLSKTFVLKKGFTWKGL
ncbi:putative beta-glucosidase from glycoside hydrolase family GH3 [Epithele typhae]|uniref:putative beta-glucosidase from glycoside hydrolase family GH3 n=1 Tax=Epithele typhae TaxID=378194 RepID=UPI0020073653|nr:putative beta-glucosidase from glycoside hydrolase family GH3 [Epithele typhae]KAH9923997.1 putative beta-glucosidase from glycoside hydrolase family GH3 [Epithele typhae]